jgi:hypothetical protein
MSGGTMPVQGLSRRTRSFFGLSFFHCPAAAFAAVVKTVQALNMVLGEALPSRALASNASRSRSQSVGVTSTHGLSSTG